MKPTVVMFIAAIFVALNYTLYRHSYLNNNYGGDDLYIVDQIAFFLTVIGYCYLGQTIMSLNRSSQAEIIPDPGMMHL